MPGQAFKAPLRQSLTRCEYRDGVDWDDEQEAIALAAIARQTDSPVPEDAQGPSSASRMSFWRADRQLAPDRYNSNPEKHWDAFYRYHSNFFKDRAWLRKEFACLSDAVESSVRLLAAILAQC